MTAPQDMVRAKPAAMASICADILAAGGCTEEESRVAAEHLVGANLTGHDSHGIARITRYHSWLRDGIIKGDTPLTTVLDAGALLQFDGGSGVGQYLAREATRAGIARAGESGIALVALRQAGHIGRLGHYAEMAASRGLVSIQFCNVAGSLLVAPFGAAERMISTNPVAVGIPNEGADPFILDFATSLVAEGKALVAATGGKALPEGALIGPDGRRTNDPAVLYGETIASPFPNPMAGPGALRTMGEHKGSGLALACDLLAGALTGNGSNAPGQRFGNGWLGIFVDPARLNDTGLFGDEVARYVTAVRGATPADGTDRVRIPGDVERETRAERRANGLPVAPRLLDDILKVSGDIGLPTTREDLLL